MGGLLFYIQADVPCREIMDTLDSNNDAIFVLPKKYESIILMGKLINSEMCERNVWTCFATYYFKCLVKEPTCFKKLYITLVILILY